MQPAVSGQPAPSAMSQLSSAQQNAFGVGRVIARTFSTWWRNVLVFSFLTLIAYVPILLLGVFGSVPIPGVNAPNPNPFDPATMPAQAVVPQGFWLAYSVTMLLVLVEAGAITHGVIHHLAGKRVSLGAMLSAGLRRALPLLLVGLLSYVIVLLGMILLLVPGVIFACALAAALPAVVVERPGIFGAIKRSFALTKGKRLAIFAIFLVLFVVIIAITAVGSFLLPQLTASFSPMLGLLLGLVVNAVFGTLFWVAPGVVYHDLRVAKEGVATAQLAAVFE